jgi:predicted  nucleic acid-binding Zn-ribbon protein
MERDGSFNNILPQRQIEIITKKKILVCEHCGRIQAAIQKKINLYSQKLN